MLGYVYPRRSISRIAVFIKASGGKRERLAFGKLRQIKGAAAIRKICRAMLSVSARGKQAAYCDKRADAFENVKYSAAFLFLRSRQGSEGQFCNEKLASAAARLKKLYHNALRANVRAAYIVGALQNAFEAATKIRVLCNAAIYVKLTQIFVGEHYLHSVIAYKYYFHLYLLSLVHYIIIRMSKRCNEQLLESTKRGQSRACGSLPHNIF
jgi:hypothetical protein